MVTAGAENFVLHHGANGLFCLCKIFRNDNAFSKSQTIGFNNRRIGVFGADIFNCPIRVVEHFILSGRNMIFFHQLFREYFAAFQYSSCLIRTEGFDAGFFKGIHHTEYQRIIRCNHCKFNLIFDGKVNHGIDIGCLDIYTFGIGGNSAVPWCSINFRYQLAFFELSDNSMFPSAAADY